MNQLSAEEILNIQILLLESPGKTLTTLHKRILSPSTINEIQILNQFDKKHLSLKLRKMIVANVQSTGFDANSNLRAFSIIVLKLIYGKELDEEILAILKSHLHSKQINFTKVTSIGKTGIYTQVGSLSDGQSKKILVQFLHSLQSATGLTKIQAQCKKYPLALQLLVIFWRTVLIKFKIPDSEDYSKKISTTAAYQILFEFLDVFYCKSGRLYLLRDENLFIQNGFERDNGEFVEEISFGNYYENEDQYMQMMLKNMPIGIGGDVKVGTSAMGMNFLTAKGQNSHDVAVNQTVSPFEMVLPKGSLIFDSTHSHNSNRSLKGSNAFQRRNFNFSSNRSQASVNLEDSQCDNPTPSFNQFFEDSAQNSFRPKDQSVDHGTVHRNNPRCPQNYIMKESATIMPVRNKILQSSLLEDLRLFDQSQKGSIQLEHATKVALGLNTTNEISGFETRDSPVNNIVGFSPFDTILDDEFKHKKIQQNHHHKPQKSSPNEQRRSMKRSQSEKNSMMKQSQIKEEQPIRQSLFSINCKKLKTSMQINQFEFGSEKKFSYRDAQQFNEKNHNDVCKHTNYSCSCHSFKLSKNKIISNTYNLAYQPLNSNQVDFKKKQNIPKIQTKIFGNHQQKHKTKLNDQFFKKLKAKRQEEKARNPSPKNKSDPKFKQDRSYRKPYFIKYSQFVKLDQKSASRSKTPNKSERPTKKKVFPTNFKKLDTFFYKGPSINPGIRRLESFKQETRLVSPKHINSKTFESQKVIRQNEMEQRKMPNPRLTNIVNSFEPKCYPAYSTPTTPIVRCQDMDRMIRNNMNDSFERQSHFESVNQGKRKISFNFFSPKSSNGFGRNDNLFYNADTGKGQQRR